MKRERLQVIATSPTGEVYELGHVSLVTSSCLNAFLKREGFDNLPPEAKRRDWRRVSPVIVAPVTHRAAFASEGWVISVERRAPACIHHANSL